VPDASPARAWRRKWIAVIASSLQPRDNYLATRICPSYSIRFTLLKAEGAGKAGRRPAPMARVQQKSTRQSHRCSRDRPASPAQWFYGLYALSPGTGFVAPVGRELAELDDLDISTGISGPRDFTAVIASFVRELIAHCDAPTSIAS
jgi:hypothetical protein